MKSLVPHFPNQTHEQNIKNLVFTIPAASFWGIFLRSILTQLIHLTDINNYF